MLTRKLFATGLFAAFFISTAPAQTYRPSVGDYVEVFRNTFTQKRFAAGKAALLQAMNERIHRDGLVRFTLIAEDRSRGELVSLVFSDPYNRGNFTLRPHVSHVHSMQSKPVQRHEFQIFQINDEGVMPRVGDEVRLYWHHLNAAGHERMKKAMVQAMLRRLQQDGYKTNAYFTESEKLGELLGIGIGEFGKPGVHASSVAHLNEHRQQQMGRDHLRIIWVRGEKR